MKMRILNWESEEINTTVPLVYIHGSFDDDKDSKFPKEVTCGSQQWPVVDAHFKVFCRVGYGTSNVTIKWAGDGGDGVEEMKGSMTIKVNCVKDKNTRYVQPVYIVCKGTDGSFISPPSEDGDDNSNSMEVALNRITFNLRLVQTFFQESLREHGFHPASFRFAENGNSGEDIDVKILISDLHIDDTMGMGPDDLYAYFHNEICQQFGTDRSVKYVAFMSCTRYHPPEGETDFTVAKIMSYARGHAALGGGRLALFGTGSLHTWASSTRDLVRCFTDERKIDRQKMFDDSCGRGWYWANYSTTLGAVVHEIGHSLDLAHTPRGIMARGHDDMNYFYTQVKGCTDENTSSLATKKEEQLQHVDNNGLYKGAHWYRSSATILDCHRWLHAPFPDHTGTSEISLDGGRGNHRIVGPFGQAGSTDTCFNSSQWLRDNGLSRLVAVVFYHGCYLEGVQFQGTKEMVKDGGQECEVELVESPIYGKPQQQSSRCVFPFALQEKLESVEIGAGAWIDSVQLNTDLKSTLRLGGEGGAKRKIRVAGKGGEGVNVRDLCWMGTAHNFVSSLFVVVNDGDHHAECTETSPIKPKLNFVSTNGNIRLLEIYDPDNGEVTWFKEFKRNIDGSRRYSGDEETGDVSLDLKQMMVERGYDVLRMSIWEDEGNSKLCQINKGLLNFIDCSV